MSDETRQVAELRIQNAKLEGRLETLEERIENVREGVRTNAKAIEILQADTRKKLDSFDGELSDSQVHFIEEIKKERDDLKKARSDSGIWWKRTSITWVVGAVAALSMAGIGALVTYLLRR